MRRWSVLAAMILAPFGMASANDSIAELTTGGLVLARSADIAMASEELFISYDEIRVDYVFRNQSDSDIETLVAFPMPDVTADPFMDVALPTDDPVNLLDFHVWVDGAAVRPDVEQRVTVAGIDHTDRLVALGVPLAPHTQAARDAVDDLPRDIQEELISLGLVIDDSYDAGQGWEHHVAPIWTLSTTFYWPQTFPAGRDLAVSHRYRPSLGGTSTVAFLTWDGQRNGESYAYYERRYCIDEPFVRAVERQRQPDGGYPFYEQMVSYVLTTGANWAGPIGRFRLVVDKGETSNYVSFCGEGVNKIAPTQFEMVKTDFWPEENLHVLFMRRYDP